MFYWFIKLVEEKRLNARFAEILSLLCNEFNKFDNTGAQMIDSIYPMTLNLLVRMSRFCQLLLKLWTSLRNVINL